MLDNLQSRNDNFILLSWLIHTFALKDIESGPLKHWQTKAAPDVAIRYWKLPVSMKCFKALKFGKKISDILFFVMNVVSKYRSINICI